MWKVCHVVGDKKGTGHYVVGKERQGVKVEVQKIRFFDNYIFFERTVNDVVYGTYKKKKTDMLLSHSEIKFTVNIS